MELSRERRQEIGYLLWRFEHRHDAATLSPKRIAKEAAQEIGIPETEIMTFVLTTSLEILREQFPSKQR